MLLTTNLGIKLNGLIKQHAYLGGTLLRLQKKAEDMRVLYEAAITAVNVTNDQLAELGVKINELSAIDIEEIRKIKETPCKTAMPHGTLARELIRVLQSHGGPVETCELVKHIVNLYGYPYNSPASRRATRKAVVCPLNLFRKRGAVTRLQS